MVDHDRGLPTCLVICGPTGGGKTTLVRRLAEGLDLVAISADSRQIYREFDIGTAKPTTAEQARAPHACLDLIEPTSRYTAYAWAAEAVRAAEAAVQARRVPLVVGGAGFYVRALVHPVTATAPAGADRYRAHYLLIDPGPVLATRIADRALAMVKAGWLEEVEALRQRIPERAPAWQACGYGAMRQHVEGRLTLDAALTQVTISTRQYAKRQRTWFRHQLPTDRVTRLNPDDGDAVDRARKWIGRFFGD
jgi:tRNA dimethylallyltransferase